MQIRKIDENGLYIVFEITDENQLKLLHFSALPWDGKMPDAMWGDVPFFPVQVKVTGENMPREIHGTKYSCLSPGYRLEFVSLEDERNSSGRLLTITLKDPETDLQTLLFWQFFDGLPIVRCRTELINNGTRPLTVEYVSTFALTGRDWRDEDLTLHIPFSSWFHEMTWKEFTLADLGMERTQPEGYRRSSQYIDISNTGSWSTKKYLPIGALENAADHTALFWQIEHNGSWHWEISDHDGYLYLQLSGPTEHQSHWWTTLQPGERFESVTAAVGATVTAGAHDSAITDAPATSAAACVSAADAPGTSAAADAPGTSAAAYVAAADALGTYASASSTAPSTAALSADDQAFPDKAGAVLTQYRRRIRRPNADDHDLPVIFNDYMNCLFGDPTDEKEYPMIDKAAEAGCEYYVIDAGWYADGEWWENVGEWKESRLRFPEGLRKVTDYIRSKGMIPGLWLELEVMGIHCPLADKLPDDWFFTRHGRRITDRSRYQLDFSNPEVRAFASSVIDRLVTEYGAGYIKMDYNIEPGIGTTGHFESAGEGLLAHNRAYLSWLAETFRRYPDLVIENCSSGGMRMDYAMLSLYSLQSTSDNEDYRRYPVIAANAPLALTPEQAAVWSYPLAGGDEEECVFNLVSAILLRIHQSGHLSNLDQRRFDLVSEGIACYKNIRHLIREAVPFWPLGLASYSDKWACLGLHCPPEEGGCTEADEHSDACGGARNDVCDDVRNDARGGARNDVCDDVRNDARGGARNDVCDDVRDDVYGDVRNDARGGARNDARGDDLIAVWRCGSDADTIDIPLASLSAFAKSSASEAANVQAEIIFPENLGGTVSCDCKAGKLRVTLPTAYSARLIRVTYR